MKNPSRYFHCRAKQSFADRNKANAAIAKIMANKRGILRPVHCSGCGEWHLTSQPEIKPDAATAALFA